MTSVGLRWGSASDVGRIRPINQDSVLVESPLFVVADGMGGHVAGEIASQVALLTLRQRLPTGRRPTASDLIAAVQMANRAVLERATVEPALRGMGTTLSGIALSGDDGAARITIVNVGDSRGYLLADGRLVQLTRDHSYVEELIEAGEISPHEARTHPRRHIVTRALGVEPMIDVDTWERPAQPGDRYLVCSDGLTNELDDEVIAVVLEREPDPQLAADALVRLANEQGGRDNISVVVIDVTNDGGERGETHVPAAIGGWLPDDLRDPRGTWSPPAATVAPGTAAPPNADAVVPADPPPASPVEPMESYATPIQIEMPPAATRRRSRAGARIRNAIFVILLIGILATAFGAIQAYGRAGYYVTFRQDRVTLYQGRPEGLLWVKPIARGTYKLSRSDLTSDWQARIDNRITFSSRAAADRWFTLLSTNPDAVPKLAPSTTTTSTTTAPTTTTSTTTPTTDATTTPAVSTTTATVPPTEPAVTESSLGEPVTEPTTPAP